MNQYDYIFTDREEKKYTTPQQLFFDYHLYQLNFDRAPQEVLDIYLFNQLYQNLDYYHGPLNFQEFIDFYAADPNIRVIGQTPNRICLFTYQTFLLKLQEKDNLVYFGLPNWAMQWMGFEKEYETIWAQILTFFGYQEIYHYMRQNLPRVVGILFQVDAMHQWAARSTDFEAIGLLELMVTGFHNQMQQYNVLYHTHLPHFYLFHTLTITLEDIDQLSLTIVYNHPERNDIKQSFHFSEHATMVKTFTAWYIRVMSLYTAEALFETKQLLSDIAKQTAKGPAIYNTYYFPEILQKAADMLYEEDPYIEIPERIPDDADATTRAKLLLKFSTVQYSLMKALKNKAQALQKDFDLTLQLQK